MTTLAIVIFLWLIASSQHTNLYSLRNLFLAVWLYYGFSVGIDLITGAEIPYTAGELNLMDPSVWNRVAFVMWNYMLCGLCFIVTYFIAQGKTVIRPVDLRYQLRTPPFWVLILVHTIAAYVYTTSFYSMNRMERIAASQLHVSYKFVILVIPVALAMDVLVILCSTGRKALFAWCLALILSLVTGNRSYVLFVFLAGAFHWRPAVRGWKLVGMLTSCALFIFMGKTAYSVALSWSVGDRVDAAMVFENLKFSLSGLDAYASYLIAAFYINDPSPHWMGYSYTVTPFMLAWPRFLGGFDVSTLAEDYVWTYHPVIAARGGAMAFSAIAEGWLNFGYAGAALVGVFWGLIANWFDRKPRGMMFFIVLLMIARLFRSDAASLFKNWVLVWGSVFVLAIGIVSIYTVMMEPTRPLLGSHGDKKARLGGSLR